MGEDRDPIDPTIKVTDRRSFTRDGLRRDPDAAPGPAPATPGPKAPTPAAAPAPGPELRGDGFTVSPGAGEGDLAAQDAAFLNLVVSIYQSGCIHLGLAEGEAESREALDFEAARGTIEMLLAIKKKTAGNLTTEESRILDTLVAELQMTYALKVSDT